MEQDVIQRIATLTRCLNEDFKVFKNFVLTREVVKSKRPQCPLDFFFSIGKILFIPGQIILTHNNRLNKQKNTRFNLQKEAYRMIITDPRLTFGARSG